MGETTSWLKALKDRFEPAVWLVGAVVVPAIGGLVFGWKAYIFPAIQSQLNDVIRQEITSANADIKNLVSSSKAVLDQLKQKYATELDSTYYLEKKFVINGPVEQSTLADQEALSTFFYVAEKDVVLLYIWANASNGVSTDMEISINDGDAMTLADFHKPAWINIDITNVVKQSSVLSGYQYPGIGENVYNIKIIPKPKVEKQRIADKSDNKSNSRKAGEPKQVMLYALVIVRRSPFQ